MFVWVNEKGMPSPEIGLFILVSCLQLVGFFFGKSKVCGRFIQISAPEICLWFLCEISGMLYMIRLKICVVVVLMDSLYTHIYIYIYINIHNIYTSFLSTISPSGKSKDVSFYVSIGHRQTMALQGVRTWKGGSEVTGGWKVYTTRKGWNLKMPWQCQWHFGRDSERNRHCIRWEFVGFLGSMTRFFESTMLKNIFVFYLLLSTTKLVEVDISNTFGDQTLILHCHLSNVQNWLMTFYCTDRFVGILTMACCNPYTTR